MKKSIKTLVEKLQESSDGKLKGGFSSIKGGAALRPPATNQTSCSNKAGTICNGTNASNCTNAGSCTDSTNTATCTNSGFCLM